MGEKNATLLSQHNSLVMVANAAIGGGGKGGKQPPVKVGDADVKDIGQGHATPEEAAAAINRMLMF